MDCERTTKATICFCNQHQVALGMYCVPIANGKRHSRNITYHLRAAGDARHPTASKVYSLAISLKLYA
jgi:hypothetical protein